MQSNHDAAAKPTLLVIIDGITWRVIQPEIQAGRLPLLSELAAAGAAQPCTSIFPSITPAATGSIITGKSPRQHGIQGAFWYDQRRGDVEYFGDAPRVVLREGIVGYFEDFLTTLNDELLCAPTLFEQVAAGRLRSASINLMWRRGNTVHEVNLPLLMKLLPGVELQRQIRGPDWLFLGDFVESALPGAVPGTSGPPGGVANRMGFNDEATAIRLEALLQSEANPDLIVAYFPDNDFASHTVGARESLDVVRSVDEQLQRIIAGAGGLDRFLQKFAIIVVGDHGHDDLTDGSDRVIDLSELLSEWQLVTPGANWGDGDELLVCPNMRAAQVTSRSGRVEDFDKVIASLHHDPRIDQIIYQVFDSDVFRVDSLQHGRLEFRELASGDSSVAQLEPSAVHRIVGDDRGRRWSLCGSLAAVDARVYEDQIVYDSYPNALARIADGSPARQRSLWLSAQPRYEFAMPGSATHHRGSHGSLHKCDSESVLITAGLPQRAAPPGSAAITDVAAICLQTLGLESTGPDEAGPPLRRDSVNRPAAAPHA